MKMEASVAIYRFPPPRQPLRRGGWARRGGGSLVKMCRWVIQFAKEGTVVAPLPRVGVGAGRKVSLREVAFHRALPAQSEESSVVIFPPFAREDGRGVALRGFVELNHLVILVF